jgi:hypothetical protein
MLSWQSEGPPVDGVIANFLYFFQIRFHILIINELQFLVERVSYLGPSIFVDLETALEVRSK